MSACAATATAAEALDCAATSVCAAVAGGAWSAVDIAALTGALPSVALESDELAGGLVVSADGVSDALESVVDGDEADEPVVVLDALAGPAAGAEPPVSVAAAESVDDAAEGVDEVGVEGDAESAAAGAGVVGAGV